MTIKVAIIGAGAIARNRHLPGFASIGGVDVVAVCNRTRAAAEQIADEFQVPRVVIDWREILEMDDVDAVVIASPPYLHCEATCAALDSGKHVLCQARMAMDVAEARNMLAKAREHRDLVAMLVPAPPALDVEPYLQHLLVNGYLGQPRFIRTRAMSAEFAEATKPLHWRQMKDISGINTLAVGIYAEVIQRLFGDTVRLLAQGSISIPQRIDPRTGEVSSVEIFDSLSIVAQMANGAHTVYEFSGVTHHAGSQFEFYGSEGTLIWDVESQVLSGGAAGDPALQPLSIPDKYLGGWGVESRFIDGIQKGKAIWPTFEEGLKYMIFTEAVMRSAATGQTITLESD